MASAVLRLVVLVVCFACASAGCASGETMPRRDASSGMDVGTSEVDAGIDAATLPDGGDSGGIDVGTVDSGPRPDGGLPIPCTLATAGVCGGRACVDGFCCDAPCDGACRACDVPGLEGLCTLHAVATDPDAECADEAASTCGTTGTCNGAGACAFHPSSAGCDDGESCTTGDACDGAGTCRGAAPSECTPAAGNECCLGSCAAGSGCRTDPGVCADQCDSNRLTIGRSCLGCGAPRAAGSCMGGGAHSCDASSHTLCQQLSCGGVTYTCTNDGGTWQWRTATRCDDGNACTHTDTCGAGTCGGTAITCTTTTCMTRACNGTSSCTDTPRTGPCDDGDLCTYGDACNASGACGGGTRVTCTDAACIDRECNGGPTCTETIRTGTTCDDGNLCTYGESCTAAGVCTSGSPISCDGMDTTCRDYSCNGTSTCASMARSVGGPCDDGVAMTTGDVCRADGTCMGSVGCALPTDACANGTQSRDRCTGARVIGRSVAAMAAGYVVTGDTCSASNRFDDCSWDAGNDHAYRMWMRTGETASIQITRTDTCFSSWSATLKIYESTGCSDVTCSRDVLCEDFIGSSPYVYTAVREGWVVFVVDGSTAFDDEGQYRLTVLLRSCAVAGCEC